MGLTSKIQFLSLFGFMATMVLLAYFYPHNNLMDIRNVWMILSLITPLTTYVTSNKIEKSIQKLRMRMKKPSEREMIESRLLEHKQELLQKLDVVQHEIEIIHSEDAEMARLANKVIKEESTGFASREDLAKMYYDLDKRIKDIENKKNNQTSTTEENTPKSDKIHFMK